MAAGLLGWLPQAAAPSPLALQVAEIASCSPVRATKALTDAHNDMELAITMLLSESAADGSPAEAPHAGLGGGGRDLSGTFGQQAGMPVASPFRLADEQAELQASLARQQAELDALAAAAAR